MTIDRVSTVYEAPELQRDLRVSLKRCISQLESGLTVIDEDVVPNAESGPIGITARDRTGAVVVIDFKDGPADDQTIGQSLAHMGDKMTGGAAVRGILVARDFTPSAVSAARAVENLRLVQFGVRFVFEPRALSPL